MPSKLRLKDSTNTQSNRKTDGALSRRKSTSKIRTVSKQANDNEPIVVKLTVKNSKTSSNDIPFKKARSKQFSNVMNELSQKKHKTKKSGGSKKRYVVDILADDLSCVQDSDMDQAFSQG